MPTAAPSTETIRRLTIKHISRYSNMLQGCSPHVNVTECAAYLKLWESIEGKGYAWDKLDLAERGEVLDAIRDEFPPEEFKDDGNDGFDRDDG